MAYGFSLFRSSTGYSQLNKRQSANLFKFTQPCSFLIQFFERGFVTRESKRSTKALRFWSEQSSVKSCSTIVIKFEKPRCSPREMSALQTVRRISRDQLSAESYSIRLAESYAFFGILRSVYRTSLEPSIGSSICKTNSGILSIFAALLTLTS